VVFAKTALTVTAITTIAWVVVTYLTSPEPQSVLVRFYRTIRPYIGGWRPIAALAPDVPPTRDLGRNLSSWFLGCVMVYLALFGTGKLLLGQPGTGAVLIVIAATAAVLLYRNISTAVAAGE
jgi:hypothetical protein